MDLNVDPSGAIECNVHEYVMKNLKCILSPYTGNTVVVATSSITTLFPPSPTRANIPLNTDPYDVSGNLNTMFYLN